MSFGKPLPDVFKNPTRRKLAAGAKVRFDDEDPWTLQLIAEGSILGYVYCWETDSRLNLQDILIYDHMRLPYPFPLSLIIRARALDMRGLGLGSMLLREVIKRAKERGISEIWGSVRVDTCEPPPSLLDWYRRHGFEVLEPDAETMRGAAHKVVLRLKSTST